MKTHLPARKQQLKSRHALGQNDLAGWLPRSVRLGMLVLIAGLVIWACVRPILTSADSNAGREDHQSRLLQIFPVTVTKVGKQFAIKSIGYEAIAYECPNANSCANYAGMPPIHALVKHQTFRFLDRSLEITSQLWLIEEKIPTLEFYVELRWSG
jgi:hypothetical protein